MDRGAVQHILVSLTPRLEQLRVCSDPVLSVAMTPFPVTEEHLGWEHLKAIRLFQGYGEYSCGPFPSHLDMRSLVSFESLHPILSYGEGPSTNPLLTYCGRVRRATQEGADVSNLRLPTLERYWHEGDLIATDLRPCLEQSFASGTLSHLAFSFDCPERQLLELNYEEKCVQKCLEDMLWLRGQPSLRTLGLFNFYISEGLVPQSRRTREQIDHLVGFACSFPNLEMLVISSRFSTDDELGYIVERIAAEGLVKKFFLRPSAHTGAMVRLRDSLKKYEAEASFEWDERIPPFPLELGTARRP